MSVWKEEEEGQEERKEEKMGTRGGEEKKEEWLTAWPKCWNMREGLSFSGERRIGPTVGN